MAPPRNKTVIIVTGPTASGKTTVAIELARFFEAEIISADSRQCFRELDIGVARPSKEELRSVPHHFIASHSIHGDDNGLILPPKIAPLQVVIVPITSKDAAAQKRIDEKARQLVKELKAANVSVKYDDNDNNRPGWKFAEYEMKGVPVRIALGARDLESNVAEVVRRDTKEKLSVSLDGLTTKVVGLLEDIQQNLFNKAKAYREDHTTRVDNWDEFEKILDDKGGFVSAHWDGTPQTEEAIKEKTKATIRCIPLDAEKEDGKCILTGKPSKQRVLFARAY